MMNKHVVATVASSATLVLLAGVLTFAMNAFASARSPSPLLEYLQIGVYLGQFIALALFLAWGPGGLIRRLALVSVVGVLWALAPRADFWLQRPAPVAGFEGEELMVFTIGPATLAICLVPLSLLRRHFGLVSLFSRGSHFPSPGFASWLILACAALVIAAACYGRGRNCGWDLPPALILGLLFALLASAVAPLLAKGLLGSAIEPDRVLQSLFPAVGILFIASGLFPAPNPDAPGRAFLAVMAAAVMWLFLLACFSFWRALGLRVQSETRNAEPSVGADSR